MKFGVFAPQGEDAAAAEQGRRHAGLAVSTALDTVS